MRLFRFPSLGSRSTNTRSLSRRRINRRRLRVERLEDRTLLSATVFVTNLNDGGPGSLRAAITTTNANPEFDLISFQKAGTGTIQLTSALPAITDPVTIDGATAPGFSGSPVVQIDYNGFGGLKLRAGSSGSSILELGLENASDNGVTLIGVSHDVIAGNLITNNKLDGVKLINSNNNLVGRSDPASVFQLSNVINSNGANGIELDASTNNVVAMNYIGTDVTGTVSLGNGQNGILITNASARNLIGGEATGGNDPKNGTFFTPPQGNLISGNGADGVLINGRSTFNQLSGNFIGTAASGNSALGNQADGVLIENANHNSLIGCLFNQHPFVFYNVISGNGGNGLVVNNSNYTTIHANFLGIGANNESAVSNQKNGLVVEGSSAHTQLGGEIPLGNVISANMENGIWVRDTASYFVSYNTFCGLAAFTLNENLGNHKDGMLITSTGGNILIRTCIISENGNDGVEISGAASDVRVVGNIIGLGLDMGQDFAMGNKNNGVEVDGNAHNILIGGQQPTPNVVPQNTISSNGANGVEVDGDAHDVTVNNSYIGTSVHGDLAFGNAGAGVLIGPGSYSNTVGSTDSTLLTVISSNAGNGIEMSGTHSNKVIGSYIGTDARGLVALGNGINGVYISNSSDNAIGPTSCQSLNETDFPDHGSSDNPANVIAFNGANGVFVASGSGNGIRGNSIRDNTSLGIDLAPGANADQTAPVLTQVHTLPASIHVAGTLTSKPKTKFTIEFFANYTSGPSGNIFLGSLTVKTNAAGFVAFTFDASRPPAGARFVTATATDPNNNTSEFSTAVS